MTTINGDVNLLFNTLLYAAAFVNTFELADRARLTFPEDISGSFKAMTTITIKNYTEVFKPLSPEQV